jgi:hypothetical protein
MRLLEEAGVPYLVGGAYSLAYHAGIVRHTKDLDLFLMHSDFDRAAHALRHNGGYHVELLFPHWLGKAFHSDAFVDLIFGSGNGLCPVDEQWFHHAVQGEALGRPARLCPAEEIIWTKSFVQERERFDGADIAHVLLARGPELDWERLMRRFATHERILLGHLLNFGYIFPGSVHNVPQAVMDQLIERVRNESPVNPGLCRGTFLSRQQYLIDIDERGFIDARRKPHGPISDEDISRWTAAIDTAK